MSNPKEFILIYKHEASEELSLILPKLQTVIDLLANETGSQEYNRISQIFLDLQRAQAELQK